MKTLIMKIQAAIGVLFFSLCTQVAYSQSQQDGLGLPGDNLNLSAVLDVFQQAKTLEEFEASLNSESYKINNLDLNYDGRTDYIKVNDFPDGNLHSIVMQIDINQNESQDVAVIYTEKRRNGDIDIQIVGDEDLYGKNYVIDLGNNQNTSTPNPGYGSNVGYNYGYDNYSSPSNWNIMINMYSPSYTRWYSPWYWGYYPRWFNPWNTFYWNDYYSHCYNNYGWQYRNYYYGNRNRFHNHHSSWYGRNRHRSDVYHNNRQRGVYAKSYQGRPPVRKPIAGKVVPVSQNITGGSNRLNTPATQFNRESNKIRPQLTRQESLKLQNQRDIKPQKTNQLQGNRGEINRSQEISRPQQQLKNQEINRPQQQLRKQEINRQQQQAQNEERARSQQQSTREIEMAQRQQQQARPQPERRQEISRPQAERRQEVSKPQLRREISRPERVQESQQTHGRPESRQQMKRQEAGSGNASARPVAQQSQTRNGNSFRSGANR